MSENWSKILESYAKDPLITLEVMHRLIIRFTKLDNHLIPSGELLPLELNQNLQYRTISPELEETGNFFMKRFTMCT